MLVMMGSTRSSFQLRILFVLLSVCAKTCIGIISGSADTDIKCIQREREALLMIKQELVDEYDHLSSWGNEEGQKDCCNWRGLRCNNQTRHVTSLDLRVTYVLENKVGYEPLKGKISPSLLELKQLTYLDLSNNDFEGSDIPVFVGSLSKLRYLNLSHASFVGTIPYQLGNLSALQFLDLNHNYDLSSENLSWLSYLPSLRYLDMSLLNLERVVDWIQTISMLHSIVDLRLGNCYLSLTIPPHRSLLNSSRTLSILDLSANILTSNVYHWLFNFAGDSLVDLDLSYTQLEGHIPDAFGDMASLVHLHLSGNLFEGGIPQSIGYLLHIETLDLSDNNLNENLPDIVWNLSGHAVDTLESLVLSSNRISGNVPDITIFSSLKYLYLDNNNLNGSLPRSFEHHSKLDLLDMSNNQITGSLPDLSVFSSLRQLDLSNNQINGSLPESIGQLSKLELLSIYSNHLQGIVSKAHFSNLTNLKHLVLYNNSLIFNLSSEWHPPFQLDALLLRSCKLGPRFPTWLRTQKNVSMLDISNSGISDAIPSWFWDSCYNSFYLNISSNQIKGTLPDLSSKFGGFPGIDLSSNRLEGLIPPLPSNITSLNLSKNMFRGPISIICAICNSDFGYLELSDNLLSGHLPDCWMQWEKLVILSLANNNFSGKIPHSMGSLLSIQSLHLRNNNLIGELPSSLQNCAAIKVIDVGENRLSGNIPAWVGETLSDLIVFRLRSNEFDGAIPAQLCYLTGLQILDLSLNSITGTMPGCFNNFTAMAEKEGSDETIAYSYLFSSDTDSSSQVVSYVDSTMVAWGGRMFEYSNKLGLVRSIDLSSNKLTGEIPLELVDLSELILLNLSRNNMTGHIPHNIGQLKSLMYLNFSRNQLSGEIPVSVSGLNFLSHLDLSNNNLSGKIPSSTQLQSLEASAFSGNPALCGPPLTSKCPGEDTFENPPTTSGSEDVDIQEEDRFIVDRWFYASIVVGFIVGFWGVCGTLVLHHSWRHVYFQFFDNSKDWLYVKIAVHTARLRRKAWPGADS